MAEVLVQDSSLQDIADAIREKNGTENTYKPSEMGDAVREISGGGGGKIKISGNVTNRFNYNMWNKEIEDGIFETENLYGENIVGQSYLFGPFYRCTELEEIPFELNYNSDTQGYCNGYFSECRKLKKLPKINNLTVLSNLGSFFSGCYLITEFDNSYNTIKFNNIGNMSSCFSSMVSLRELPNQLIKNILTKATSSLVNMQSFFQNCNSLNKISNLYPPSTKITSNKFSLTFTLCTRINELTFEMDESNLPYVRDWNSQTIDLSTGCGYANGSLVVSNILNYNSGITADKEVTDDATYQALKNNPDWFTQKIEYSRYNHDSAVNTINSLPDCSSGSGNTITFDGDAGSKTDGGAINTLTPEEIAVATAKGWTVSFV